ncbi:mannosyltransferase [Ceratocystis pirilliformis]|uniref:Mannosyltransferase n=1 Tax=Ceratocystis pirilliformis TaxID=259994 RepID=A0ABR3Z7R5_9PEZI
MKPTSILTSSLLAVSVSAAAITNTIPSRQDSQQPFSSISAEHEYFKQASFNPQYDPRFASEPLPYVQQKAAMQVLIQTCLSTLADLGIEAWLMHNTLLGWWWGQHNLPWTSEADLQIAAHSLSFLAAYYNMTMFFFKYPDVPEGRHFRLEINPHFASTTVSPANHVDARWIDLQTGLYIDLAAIRYERPRAPGAAPTLRDKRGFHYADTDIFPLWETTYEGVNAMIPHNFKRLLVDEFGVSALTDMRTNSHFFQEDTMTWEHARSEKEFSEL